MHTYLTDGTIAIRPFQPADIPVLFAATQESIAELSTWMVWCRPGYSLDDCADFVCHSQIEWVKGVQYSFVISDARNSEFLGSIGINRLDRVHYFANLAYWVRRSRSGQGWRRPPSVWLRILHSQSWASTGSKFLPPLEIIPAGARPRKPAQNSRGFCVSD